MLKQLLIVINPKAGTKGKDSLRQRLPELFGNTYALRELVWTIPEFDLSAAIRKDIGSKPTDAVIAMGGDGTVNATAAALTGTTIPLGIIPFGSGNGLARHLGIPLKAEKAIESIKAGHIVSIDSCSLNGTPYFCTAGIGFDAHIGQKFAIAGERGFATYTRIVAKEFPKYKSQEYEIVADGKSYNRKAFMITVANANQYGNNVFVAPHADISDGIMNVVILAPFSLIHAPALATRLFVRRFNKASKVETFPARSVVITRSTEGPVHYDGEPGLMGSRLEFGIAKESLKVIVP